MSDSNSTQNKPVDQFIRKVSLVFGDGSNNTIDVSNLRIAFRVGKATVQTPNHAIIVVNNLSADTANRIQKEYKKVVLKAGYEGSFGVIFNGTSITTNRGRENQATTYLEISAAEGDQAYNFGVVNTSLAAGSTSKDRIEAARQAMEEHGVYGSYVPELNSNPAPRGTVVYGMARDTLRDEARTNNLDWSIQGDKLVQAPRAGVLPGAAVVLTEKTGLVGLPRQTEQGIVVTCLLNPNIKTGGKIKIDNASVQQATGNPDYTALNYFPSLSNDGFYKVLAVEYEGDTRGGPWYSKIICIALDGDIPLGFARAGIITENF